MDNSSIEIKVITSWTEAESLQPIWDELFEASEVREVFSRFGWCQAWWRVFGPAMEARVVLIRRAGLPVCLAPLVISRRASGPFHFRVLQLIGAPQADYLNILLREPDGEILALLRQQLQVLAREVDYIALEHLTELTPARPGETSPWEGPGLRWRRSALYVTRSADLRDRTYDQFFAGLPKGIRYDLRRYEKDLAAIGPIQVESIGPDQAAEHFDRFWAFLDHRETVTGRNLERDSKQQFEAFFRALLGSPASEGLVRFATLRVAGEPVAYHFGFADESKFYYYKPTFNMDWAKTSPGKVLIAHLIRDSIAAGRKEFDFLMGEEDYKRKWAPTERSVWDLRAYPPSRLPRFPELWHESLKPRLKRFRAWTQGLGGER